MRDAGLKAVIMSGDGIADNEYAAIAGPAAEGTLMTFPPEPRNHRVDERASAAPVAGAAIYRAGGRDGAE